MKGCKPRPPGGWQFHDLNTLKNPNSTYIEKGLAGGGILLSATPLKEAKLLKSSKVFSADQAALIDLAKGVEKSGVNVKEAKILVDWANELGIKNHDIMSHENRAYWKIPHIKIFNSHIPINE